MDDLAQILNNDVVYYIKQCTIDRIKKDARNLLEYFNERVTTPSEPPGGKQYNMWIQYMLYYTKNVKPVEDKFRNLYKEISECNDFDTSQKLYVDLKDTFDKWYSVKKRSQYSGNYNYE